jgi:hypothetical protein
MLVVEPIADTATDKAVSKVTKRVRQRGDGLIDMWKVWMPYHKIQILCLESSTSSPREVTTALNAVFCADATEQELLQLFRPKHLEKPLRDQNPKADEIVLCYPRIDLQATIARLTRARAQARDGIAETQPQLVKGYRSMQWRNLLFPMSTRSIEKEKKASSKLAELQSIVLAIDICLNLEQDLVPQDTIDQGLVYIPMVVVLQRQGIDGTGRYLFIDLATGREDIALNRLCETSGNFASSLEVVLGRVS